MGEVRYASLKRGFPAIAENLFDKNAAEARERYETYKALAEMGAIPAAAKQRNHNNRNLQPGAEVHPVFLLLYVNIL